MLVGDLLSLRLPQRQGPDAKLPVQTRLDAVVVAPRLRSWLRPQVPGRARRASELK
jgi:hypothetical protein